MESIEHGELILDIYTEGNTVKNMWKGASRDLKPGDFFNKFSEKLIARARGKKLIIDFTELDIMNSSTIRFLISLFTNLEKESIPTNIIYNSNSNWQAYCFKPIAIMMKNFQLVKVHAKSSTS